jgi:hypothetical protein
VAWTPEPRESEPWEWESREAEPQEWEALVWEAPESAAVGGEDSLTAVSEPEVAQDSNDQPGALASFPWEPAPFEMDGTGSPDNRDLIPPDGGNGGDAPMEEGQAALQPRSSYGGDRDPVRASQAPVSSLLKQLELLGEDQELFQSILDGIRQAGEADPAEREKIWYVISGTGWYENISRNNSFRSGDLAGIFALVVIPELAGQLWAEAIAKWVIDAPVPMVEGLLAAAQADGPEAWDTAMGILEPMLAYRWTIEHYMRDYWHSATAVRQQAGPGRVDSKSGFLGIRRRPGGRHRG